MTPEGLTALADVERPTNPFPGLRPFEFGESHLYFGRDGQSDQLIRKLAATRFVAVVGTSGSGKSSLVRAGLLPDLFGGFMPGAGSHWRACLMRPGNDPLGALARALSAPDVFGSDDEENRRIQAAIAEATLRRGSLGLVEAVRQNRMAPNESLLVVVDQFEELFRFARVSGGEQYRYEAAAFVKLLLEAARQREQSVYVVLTMRSDFLGDCSVFWDLPEAVNEGQYLIPRMTRDQRAEAVTGPVAVGGGRITQRLVNRLLNDTGDNPDLLPILQHALMRTWENWAADHAEGEPLDLRHYEAVGAMADALSRHADEAFGELPDDRSRLIAERVFKALTEKGEDNREVRRPIVLGGLCAQTGAGAPEVAAVIEVFRREGRSFLMPPASVPLDEESLIDISHESLIRNWQRLKDWVDLESHWAQIYRRLAETAVLHERGQAGLWRDPDLQVALDWRELTRPTAAWAARYHPAFESAMSFLDASVAERKAEALAKEQARRRAMRNARLAAVVFFILFVTALVALFFAYTQTVRAQAALRQAVEAHGAADIARREARTLSDIAEEKKREAREAGEEAERKRRQAEEFKDKAEEFRVKAEGQATLAALSIRKADEARREAAEEQARAAAATAGLAEAEAGRRGLIYASDMGLAYQAYDSGSVARARLLLDAHSAERGDSPGFDWYYLWKLMHDEPKTLKLWEPGLEGQARDVGLTDDGRTMAVARAEGVELWEMPAGRKIGSHKFDEEAALTTIAISNDGRRLAYNSVVKATHFTLADVGSPQSAVQLRGQVLEVSALAFSPDGRTLAVGHDQGGRLNDESKPKLELWDVNARRVTAEFEHQAPIIAVAFSPVQGRVATGTSGGAVTVWDVNSKDKHCEVVGREGVPVLAFSQDGALLAAGDWRGTVSVLRMSNCELSKMTLPGPKHVETVAFTPDRRRLAVGYSDKSLRVWDISSHFPEEIIAFRHNEGVVRSLRFLPDGTLLAINSDGAAQLWDIEARVRAHWLNEARGALNAVAFSSDGRVLAAGGYNRAIILWDAETHRKLGERYLLDFGKEGTLDFSWRGRTLATVTSVEGKAKLWEWDGAAFKEAGGIEDEAGAKAGAVSLSPDGKRLLVGGLGGDGKSALALWDVASKRVIARVRLDAYIYAVAFSPDGSRIGAAIKSSKPGDATLTVWDGHTMRELFTRRASDEKDPKFAPLSLAFSPDARFLVVGSRNGYIKAWNLPTGEEVVSAFAHTGDVSSIAFSPDTRTFATGGDKVVKLWSASSFQQLATLKGHIAEVMSVAFSPDGKKLASADIRGAVRVWRAAADGEVGGGPRRPAQR